MKEELEKFGYYIYRNVINDNYLITLREIADDVLKGKKDGACIHAIVKDITLIDLLSELDKLGILKDIENDYFKSLFIINSFSVLNNIKDNPNFSSNIHRDIRFFSGNCNLMLNCLLFLDDFTVERGATKVLPMSHKLKTMPSKDVFDKKGVQLIGKAGDLAIWNSNLYHCSMLNNTNDMRRAIPFVFQKSAMKQLLDYPRALKDKRNEFSSRIQQLLGFDSIVPASLEEWCSENRTYKKNQD